MSKCKAKFSIDKQFHERNRHYVFGKMVEHGGNTRIDVENKVIKGDQTVSGAYAKVSIPRGIVDFHTHPAKCLNDNNCTVGLPSPADLVNIYAGVLRGMLYHLVYAREGTYVLEIQPKVRAAIKAQGHVPERMKQTVIHEFNALHEQFKKRGARDYAGYRADWMRRVKKHGFYVRFYPLGKRPVLNLEYDCGKLRETARPKPRVSRPRKRKTKARRKTTK